MATAELGLEQETGDKAGHVKQVSGQVLSLFHSTSLFLCFFLCPSSFIFYLFHPSVHSMSTHLCNPEKYRGDTVNRPRVIVLGQLQEVL